MVSVKGHVQTVKVCSLLVNGLLYTDPTTTLSPTPCPSFHIPHPPPRSRNGLKFSVTTLKRIFVHIQQSCGLPSPSRPSPQLSNLPPLPLPSPCPLYLLGVIFNLIYLCSQAFLGWNLHGYMELAFLSLLLLSSFSSTSSSSSSSSSLFLSLLLVVVVVVVVSMVMVVYVVVVVAVAASRRVVVIVLVKRSHRRRHCCHSVVDVVAVWGILCCKIAFCILIHLTPLVSISKTRFIMLKIKFACFENVTANVQIIGRCGNWTLYCSPCATPTTPPPPSPLFLVRSLPTPLPPRYFTRLCETYT